MRKGAHRWATRPLAEVAKAEWGNTSITKASYVESGFPAFSATGADGFLPKAEWEGPAVILSAIGARCGKCFYADGEWTAIKNTIVIQADSSTLSHKFLFYYLNDATRWKISGSGQPFITLKTVRETEVPSPPLWEQDEIVAEIEKQFPRLEAGVAALRRAQASLKRYRATVLDAARDGRLVPKEIEWSKTTLGAVSTVLSGYGFPERLQGRTSGEIGFFKVGDISEAWKRNEKVLTHANHYISNADLAELRAKLLPPGTVVFAKIGAAIALNRRAIIGEPSLVDNNVMGLLAGERIHPRYLFHFLCTQKLDELARATTVPSIRKGDVEEIELKLPPLAEQTQIVAEVERRLSLVEELEAVVSVNLQRATRLRQSVLQQAFSGTI